MQQSERRLVDCWCWRAPLSDWDDDSVLRELSFESQSPCNRWVCETDLLLFFKGIENITAWWRLFQRDDDLVEFLSEDWVFFWRLLRNHVAWIFLIHSDNGGLSCCGALAYRKLSCFHWKTFLHYLKNFLAQKNFFSFSKKNFLEKLSCTLWKNFLVAQSEKLSFHSNLLFLHSNFSSFFTFDYLWIILNWIGNLARLLPWNLHLIKFHKSFPEINPFSIDARTAIILNQRRGNNSEWNKIFCWKGMK